MSRKIKVRRKWAINPRTRVKESKKVYSRKKTAARLIEKLETEQYA